MDWIAVLGVLGPILLNVVQGGGSEIAKAVADGKITQDEVGDIFKSILGNFMSKQDNPQTPQTQGTVINIMIPDNVADAIVKYLEEQSGPSANFRTGMGEM